MKSLNYLSKDDYYEVKLGSMLASYDRDILTTLYQPIIGYAGLALYFTLWSEVKRGEFSTLNKHEILLKEMGIEITSLFESRRALEAIGLLKTYKSKISKHSTSYLYELFAPKSPEDFFNDVIYKGMLSQKIGAKEVEKLSLIFASKPIDVADAEDITATFSDVYNINEDESLKVINLSTKRGRKTINIASNFNVGDFFKQLELTSMISKDAFTTEDVNEITRLSTLFGLDILSMSEIVSEVYDPANENHLDYSKLFSLSSKYKEGINIKDTSNEIQTYSGDDEFTKKLNEMNSFSPFEYLRLKQGFTTPSPADVKIINLLSQKYGLNGPVINAVIDYTLIVCNDSLPSAYVEKIAAMLARKGVKTANAACNALVSRKKNKTETISFEYTKPNKPVDNSSETDNDKLDMDALMQDLENL